MENSLLSVVIIAKKNTSLSMRHALDSICRQLYSPIELLVVDANEPNSLYSLGLQEDMGDYPMVEYRRMDHQLSVAELRNLALSYVKGDYVAYMSCNDVWDTTKALLQMEQLRLDAEAAASCSNGVLLDKRKAHVEEEALMETASYDSSKWVLYNPAKMSAQVIYRRAAIQEAGGFDGQFVNFCDGDMLLRLSKRGKVLLLPVSLCECSIPPEEDNYDRNTLIDHQRLLDKHLEYFLADRHMTQMFYKRMMHLARVNYMWLNFMAYSFLYFIKAPGRTTFSALKESGRMLRYLFKWLHLMISMLLEVCRRSRDIRLMKQGKLIKIKALMPVTDILHTERKPLMFSSARHYNGQKPLDYALNRRLKSIVIPEHVTVIKENMFYGCDQLISVEIPNTVIEIQAHAFHRCRNLRYVSIQEGSRLEKIGAYAFAGCSALETLSLPSGLGQIARNAFFECSSLKQLLFTYQQRGEEKISSVFPSSMLKLTRYSFAGCVSLQQVEFESSSMLETIEEGAFLGCNMLKKSVLPGKVTALGSYAFAHCKKLETIAFVQIDALMNIGRCAFMNCQSLSYFKLPDQLEHIYERTFYGCSGIRVIKIPKKVLSISHQAFAKCTLLQKAVIMNGDATIASTAFDKHTELRILGAAEKEASS